jgi:hypothetical protein
MYEFFHSILEHTVLYIICVHIHLLEVVEFIMLLEKIAVFIPWLYLENSFLAGMRYFSWKWELTARSTVFLEKLIALQLAYSFLPF